jgi:hypothetical protein
VNGQNDPTTPTPQPLPGITRYGLDDDLAGRLAFDIFCLALGNVFLTDLGHSLVRNYSSREGAEALLATALASAETKI